MKKFRIKITNEREITMDIETSSMREAKRLIEEDAWKYYTEDENETRVKIEASKGFKINDKKWKIKSIKEI